MNKFMLVLSIGLLSACSPKMQTHPNELSASEEEAQERFIQGQDELEREAKASADFAPPPDSPDETHLLPNAASREYNASDWVDDYASHANPPPPIQPMNNQPQSVENIASDAGHTSSEHPVAQPTQTNHAASATTP